MENGFILENGDDNGEDMDDGWNDRYEYDGESYWYFLNEQDNYGDDDWFDDDDDEWWTIADIGQYGEYDDEDDVVDDDGFYFYYQYQMRNIEDDDAYEEGTYDDSTAFDTTPPPVTYWEWKMHAATKGLKRRRQKSREKQRLLRGPKNNQD